MKGVDPEVCQHTIPMRDDAKPSKQRPYSYNDNFAQKIDEEINKLKEAGFIYEIEHTEWVSPLVVVPKKNGKLRVCVNLKEVKVMSVSSAISPPISGSPGGPCLLCIQCIQQYGILKVVGLTLSALCAGVEVSHKENLTHSRIVYDLL